MLAGTTEASLLNLQEVEAYQHRLAEERREDGHGFGNTASVYKPSPEAVHPPHPGVKVIVDPQVLAKAYEAPAPPSPALFKPPPKKVAPPQHTSLPAKRDPYGMCKQYADPVIFQECIKFYADQNEKID